MPATWAGWKYNIGGGLVNVDYTDLSVIRKGNGYGVDGDGDGKADPYNLTDAIYSTANYLSKNGFTKDPYKAIFNYNHADWYVKKVMNAADRFHTQATYKTAEGSVPVSNDTMFTLPAKGRVSSGFGGRWGSMHYGIDIAGKGKIPVVAAADGIVSRSYRSDSYGHVIFIKHSIKGKSYETVYAHLASRAVRQGTIVKRGQFIGYMGSTGHSTGQHLHFEVHEGSWNYSKSNAKNPALYLPLNKLKQ
ncbi:M23 family metallopeptidase [Bacillus swezeyi]|uniref:M23 family peptidase n=1 Tax=Bacillus swezeyi TaxID=1925020 RepID=A0A5M8REF8_9BACI|nr:M23 family metallopeptidase [Bacillus swezeyi]KAA6446987.1 M23 family peptidase [Bacillus swezeyi]KAA6471555.1 M23 family peptidase [Bacillus swezeyi]